MTKKKSKRFQFELGIPGLIFVTGLLICLFLWMFVLGFWLGQKMVASKAKEAASPVAQKALKEAHQSPSLVAEEIKTPKVIPEKPAKKELLTRPLPKPGLFLRSPFPLRWLKKSLKKKRVNLRLKRSRK